MKYEIYRFLIVGISAVLIDFPLYYWLVSTGTSTLNARVISIVLVGSYAYLANKYFTFRSDNHHISSIGKYILVYVAALSIGVATNEFLLNQFGKETLFLAAFYTISTGLAAAINFLTLKYYVFR